MDGTVYFGVDDRKGPHPDNLGKQPEKSLKRRVVKVALST